MGDSVVQLKVLFANLYIDTTLQNGRCRGLWPADWLVRGNNPDETLMIAVKALDRAGAVPSLPMRGIQGRLLPFMQWDVPFVSL